MISIQVQSKMEDYIFSTPEGAEKKSMDIGFNGDTHKQSMADGTPMYFPAKTEEEFITWYRKNDSDAEEELGAESPSAAEYQGKKVKLNKPFRMPKGNSKKFGVYTKNEKGNVVLVRFGDPKMEIRRDDDKARKNYRSRMGCDTPRVGPKWKANYWSCKMWEKGKSVKDYTSSVNKTDDTVADDMGDCGCGDCGCSDVKIAEEVTTNTFTTQEEAEKASEAIGCKGFHTIDVEGETLFMPCDSHATYEEVIESAYHTDSCGVGEEMQNGKCVKVAFQIDVDITVDDMVMQADTGEYIIAISGIAFHQGVNKNNWEITRAGANLAVPQMVGADLTLNHPKSENGRFTRNMEGGIDEAVVGFVTEAITVDKMGGNWEVRFKAEVHRSELFEALESGLWLREGYGVSIGGMGIPDEMIEAEDGSHIMRFESDFQLDHLAIVHRPAYSGARIESIQRLNIAESAESFNSHKHSVLNIAKETNAMSDEEIIVASEEVVIETPVLEEVAEATEEVITPDYAAEIEALKASLAERDEKLNAIKVAEETQAENSRLSLVQKATEMGIAGVADLSSETIETIMASFEAVKPIVATPVKEMTPVASNVEATARPPVHSEEVVANYLNRKLVKTPVSLYAKAWNAWAGAWNQTLSATERQSSGAPTFEEARKQNLI